VNRSPQPNRLLNSLSRSAAFGGTQKAIGKVPTNLRSRTKALVGIELRRAGCRWRVTKPALSIASWVLISTVATFSKAPL